jgi:hypothetical protein
LFSDVADVATTFNIFLMLQTLILDVADAEFDVADILCVVSRGRPLDVGCYNY